MTAHMACIASSLWVPEIADTDVHNMFAVRFRDHRILAGRQNSHTILLRRYIRRATGANEANRNQRNGGSILCATGRSIGHSCDKIEWRPKNSQPLVLCRKWFVRIGMFMQRLQSLRQVDEQQSSLATFEQGNGSSCSIMFG